MPQFKHLKIKISNYYVFPQIEKRNKNKGNA